MNKRQIRLTESDLHNMVMEAAYRVLNENEEDEIFDNARNKIASGFRGMKNAVQNGGGINCMKAGYNDSRAKFYQGQQNAENGRIDKQIAQIQQEINSLDTKREQLQGQIQRLQGSYGQRYASAIDQHQQRSNAARENFRNAWGINNANGGNGYEEPEVEIPDVPAEENNDESPVAHRYVRFKPRAGYFNRNQNNTARERRTLAAQQRANAKPKRSRKNKFNIGNLPIGEPTLPFDGQYK